MAKINLLTIHWGMSYGAIMQTYATCKLLEESGHNVSVINIVHPKQKIFYTNIRAFFCFFMDAQFSFFKRRYFPSLTPKMYRIDLQYLKTADYIIVGSDQTWNRDITSPLELNYFVDFAPNVKKVSLSSSFGKFNWSEDEEYTNRVKELLHRFDALSVREDSGKDILKNCFGLESTVLVDPTLAYGKYDDLLLHQKPNNQIYTFFVNEKSQYENIIEHISKDLNLSVFRHSKISYYLKNSPRHWLTYIKNSSVVITDSFHGVVFSVIFKKDFFVLCGDDKKFTRINYLLSSLGIKGRYIRSIEDYESRKNTFAPIDYTLIDCILRDERAKYRSFINENIK